MQTGAIDLESFLEEIEKIINNLKHFSDKLDTACAELSLCAANLNQDEEYVQFIEEDNLIQTEAFSCISELERRRKSIKEKYMEPALEDQVIQLQTQVQQLVTDQQEQQAGQGLHGQYYRSGHLPKLEMPSFNGDALRWSEFWDSFEANVDKTLALSNIEKLSYLNSKLHGEAKQAVSGIPLSNDNYQVAKTILKDRFGKSKSVVTSHYTQLMNLKPATNTTKGLRVLYDNKTPIKMYLSQ